MKYIKLLLLAAFFVISMLFFFQNTVVLSDAVILRLDLYWEKFISRELPLYVIMLGCFVIGVIATMLHFIADKLRMNSELKKRAIKIRMLEKELNSLRNMPLEDRNFPSAGDKGYMDQDLEEKSEGESLS